MAATTSSMGAGQPGRLPVGAGAAGLEHDRARPGSTHVEDLGPAVAEPAVADHQGLLAGGELAGYGFHAEGAAAGHDTAEWA